MYRSERERLAEEAKELKRQLIEREQEERKRILEKERDKMIEVTFTFRVLL